MAKSFSELGERAEYLIDNGEKSIQQVELCKRRLEAASMEVTMASSRMASLSDVEGDNETAQLEYNIAIRRLEIVRRDLESAVAEQQRIEQEKYKYISEIEKRNVIERNNIEKLEQIQQMKNGSSASALAQQMIERYNAAENYKERIARSLGLDIAADYYRESSALIYGNYGLDSLVWNADNEVIDSSKTREEKVFSGQVDVDNADMNQIRTKNELEDAFYRILADPSMPNIEKMAALDELRSQVISQLEFGVNINDINANRDAVKILKLSTNEKYEIGERFIDNMMDLYRENFRNYGVLDGDDMEKAIANIRSEFSKVLISDIENGTNNLYDHTISNFQEIADNLKKENSVNSLLASATINDLQRKQIREGIQKGTITEQNIREIGRKVRDTYDQLILEKHNCYETIIAKKKELFIAMKNAKSGHEKEMIELESKNLIKQQNELNSRFNTPSMIREILSQHRSVGPTSTSQSQPYSDEYHFGSSKVVKAINNVREFIPTDWVERSNGKSIIAKHTIRGYFFPGADKDVIALSGNDDHMRSCAFHEMGHRFENMYPEILMIEKQFYDRRTRDEELKWLGPGYSKDEVTRFDHFIKPYMGKDYGGEGYELLSMGLEGLYCDTFNISRDEEYEDLILGILVSI